MRLLVLLFESPPNVHFYYSYMYSRSLVAEKTALTDLTYKSGRPLVSFKIYKD